VTDDEPRPMRELNAELPPWFDMIVTKLLMKSASDRFASSEAVTLVF
jgi:hypothetical protein